MRCAVADAFALATSGCHAMHETSKTLNARWRDNFMLYAQAIGPITGKHDELPFLSKAAGFGGMPSVSNATKPKRRAELHEMQATHGQVSFSSLEDAICWQHVFDCGRVVVLLQLNNVNMNGNNRDCGIQELTKQ